MSRHKKPLQGLLVIVFIGIVVVGIIRVNLSPQASQPAPSPSARSITVRGVVVEDGIPVVNADVYCLYTTADDPYQWKKDITPVKSKADGTFSCNNVPALSTATEIPVVAQKGDEWCDAKAKITGSTTASVTINLDKDKKGESKIYPEPDPKQKEAITVTATRVYPKATGGIQAVNPDPSVGVEPAFNDVPAGYYNILVTEPAIEDKKCGRAAVSVTGDDETVSPKLPMECDNKEYLLVDINKGSALNLSPQQLKRMGYNGAAIGLFIDGSNAQRIKEFGDSLKREGMHFFVPTGYSGSRNSTTLNRPDRKQLWAQETLAMKNQFAPTGYFLNTWEEFCGGGAKRHYPLTQGEIATALADVVSVIQTVDPGKPTLVWGDPFSPYHNAHDGYMGKCKRQDGTKSWENFPTKDVIIINWDNKLTSAKHFADIGVRQLVTGFVDDGDSPTVWVPCNHQTAKKYRNELDGLFYFTWKGNGNFNKLDEWIKAWKNRDELVCRLNIP